MKNVGSFPHEMDCHPIFLHHPYAMKHHMHHGREFRGKRGARFDPENTAEWLFHGTPLRHGEGRCGGRGGDRGGGRGRGRGGRGGGRGGRGGGHRRVRGGMGAEGPPGPFGSEFMGEAADFIGTNSSILEKNDEKTLRVFYDVAGYSPEDIDVRVDEGGVIHVTGSRVNRVGMEFRLEEVRNVDVRTHATDQISSEMLDGVLEIVVPKNGVSNGRSVPITTDAKMITKHPKSTAKNSTSN